MATKFEAKIINPILRLIKNNQVYLTKSENLDQLAKLGYIYNTLWYAGRICWGYDGIIQKGYECEDNPKYKIEMCNPISETIEDLIYDAWGMHVDDMDKSYDWDVFITNVKGRQATEVEALDAKHNKTIDDWVKLKTHPDYRFKSLFPNRKSILNYLFCVIGSSYAYSNGYIIETASGADQDKSVYGFWPEAQFKGKIANKVNEIVNDPLVKQTLDATKNYIYLKVTKKKEEEEREHKELFEQIKKALDERAVTMDKDTESEFMEMYDLLTNKKENPKEEKYSQYYPICEYSPITKVNKTSEASTFNAAIEVCQEILLHKDKERAENVKFAEKFLKRNGI